ncbi:hypothetical protein [Brevundimonas sp.]|jgi:hypothetical protein|uniref:hypothetical protein n=1 Tax=Brevundimonas sp. TaxID=1871086 RepID=UPI00378355E6
MVLTRTMRPIVVALAAIGLLAACATAGEAAPAGSGVEPAEASCPEGLPARTACYRGRSDEGAFYWIAIPADWNGTLVVHAHGGPRTPPPAQDDPVEDLQRFAVTVREGYAWAGSTYRRGGYGVRMAAEDTEILRTIFWDRFGKPRRTFLHGQSWGGNVAAKAAELYAIAADGSNNYDGVMLSAGVTSGGTRAYGFRANLRAVYQFYCRNHPRPDEQQYPIWQGLPADQSMTRAELSARVEECTGVGLRPSERTSLQTSNLRNIVAVTGIGEQQLVAHLAWATNLFQDIVHRRLGGLNPFSNAGVAYVGSDDDVALNAGVERFSADPMAVARLSYDADLSGMIVLPTVTIHAKFDPTVFVSVDHVYRRTVETAGRSDLLVQTFTDEADHSKLSNSEYAALLGSLSRWVETGARPSPHSIAADCEQYTTRYGEPCLFDVDFVPTTLDAPISP